MTGVGANRRAPVRGDAQRAGSFFLVAAPLGCDVRDRKLVINEEEAERVRMIFRRYLAAVDVASSAPILNGMECGVSSAP